MNEKSAEAAFVQPRHTRKATKNDPLLADSSEQVSDPASVDPLVIDKLV
jgi:hypothetical protein